jgi:hypothetical protein
VTLMSSNEGRLPLIFTNDELLKVRFRHIKREEHMASTKCLKDGVLAWKGVCINI